MSKPFQATQISIPEGFIDLGRGDPQLALLPLELLHRGASLRLADADNSFLQYGPEQGDAYLRAALAGFLAGSEDAAADPEPLFITSGISAALDLLCTLLARAGDTVFVEEPSYFLALRIFADHGLRLVPIPTDESGLVIEALEEALKIHHPKFLYVIPAFQNPGGHTLTQERRLRLLSLSHEHGFILLADEVYQQLHYAVEPPKSFGSYREAEHVISLGSFSKILAPGLRLGWLQASPAMIQRLTECGLLTSGGGMNPFTSAIVRSLIESGALQDNITRLRRVYSARVQAMEASLRRHLPDAEFVAPQGGYFFWVRFPGRDLELLQETARAHQVDYRPGSLFSCQNGLRDYIRLSISFYDPGEIDEGVRRLQQALSPR